LQLDGSIQANGASGSSHAGGGSGGSIWVRVDTLSGAGAMNANGGNARSGYSGSGGGGGRVAVYYGENEGFDLEKLTALGGLRGNTSFESAGAGTVYLVDESRQSRELRLIGQERAGRTTAISGEPEGLTSLLIQESQVEVWAEEISRDGVVT